MSVVIGSSRIYTHFVIYKLLTNDLIFSTNFSPILTDEEDRNSVVVGSTYSAL